MRYVTRFDFNQKPSSGIIQILILRSLAYNTLKFQAVEMSPLQCFVI